MQQCETAREVRAASHARACPSIMDISLRRNRPRVAWRSVSVELWCKAQECSEPAAGLGGARAKLPIAPQLCSVLLLVQLVGPRPTPCHATYIPGNSAHRAPSPQRLSVSVSQHQDASIASTARGTARHGRYAGIYTIHRACFCTNVVPQHDWLPMVQHHTPHRRTYDTPVE